MISLVDVQQVAPRVLARLKELAPLPNHGVVAGQSVATLIYEELGLPISGALNDIDVFVSRHLPARERGVVYTNEGYKTKRRTTPFTQSKGLTSRQRKITVDVSDIDSSYKYLNIIGQRGTISILRTYRKDLLNYTLIDGEGMGPSGFVNVQVGQGLVNGFDLNCVAVGIDLNTGRLVCTDDFIAFLNTHELKPQSYHTPGYTLIRMAKKLFGDSMSGVKCDFEKEKDILLCASELQQKSLLRHYDDGAHLHTFGPKYAEMMKPFAHHLPSMVESKHDNISLWAFVAPEGKNEKLEQMSAGWKRVASLHVEFARSILYTKHLGAIWNLNSTQRADIFNDLKDDDTDHYEILCALKDPVATTDKCFKHATKDEMHILMANSSLSVPEQDAMVDIFNSWTTEQVDIFQRLKGEFHEIALFEQEPVEFYQRKFLEFGLAFFQNFNSTHTFFASDVFEPIMAFAQTPDGRELVRRSLEDRNFTGNYHYTPLPIPVYKMTEQLVNIALGPDLHIQPTDNTKMVSNMMSWLVNTQAPVPSTMPSLQAARALRKISHLPSMKNSVYTQYHTDVLQMLLSCATDEHLKDIYLFNFIQSDGQDHVEQRLVAMEDSYWEDFKKLNFQKIEEFFAQPERDIAVQTTTIFFERISLNRAVGEVSKPVRSTRKM